MTYYAENHSALTVAFIKRDIDWLKSLPMGCPKKEEREIDLAGEITKYWKEFSYTEFVKWADLEEDETVTNCHQLEEAARNSWFNYEFDCGALYSKCYKDGFKAGANWQREQFHDACYQCEKAYDNVFFRGEQHAIKMLKEEAIEGKCIDIGMAGVVIDTDYGCLFLPQNTFKIGDKVKIIILKDGNED